MASHQDPEQYSDEAEATGFAPHDPKDGRESGEWRTRYADSDARKAIRLEATYLGLHLFLALAGATLVATQVWDPWMGIPSTIAEPSSPFAMLFLGGLAGGTIYSIKWLYHAVARAIWNIDRRLWRFFTPYLSATVALAVGTLIASDLLAIFDPDSLRSPPACFAIGFLSGYSSDMAVAKLIEVSETLFGTHGHHQSREVDDVHIKSSANRNSQEDT